MSQFRIKHIDNAIPDEWVYKLNDGTNVVGDDIDARDPNELADAIFDTQTLLLKVSTLPPGAILKPSSGLAERITILEGIAGNSTLQDIYTNGHTISVVTGKPLTFGIREEFKLDDAGNLSFKPVTMKVRGTGFQTLDFTNLSVTTNLGDLLVGATSPGSKLTLRAEDYLYLKDVFLTNPVTLSEPGNTVLTTLSQSIVGAINELKASSFSTSLQAVYSQSTPPKLVTNATQGAVIIEDPNPLSAADALRVAGILNVTKRAKVGDLRIGLNTTVADTVGYLTSDPIKTTNRIETPAISSGTSELNITDKRVSFPFSDNSVTGLNTVRQSIVGAINELKGDITTVGNAGSLFNVQHDAASGNHKIITTQAEVGQNATKRIVVRNQSGTETFSLTGSGDIVANTATVGGLSVVSLLNQLVAHIANDGTAHSAFAAHLLDPNPHNTVKQILGLTGNVSLSSSNGTIDITTSGNTIDFKFNNTVNLQEVYNNLVTKELVLNTTGLLFKDNTNATIVNFRAANLGLHKDIYFETATPVLGGANQLFVRPTNKLTLSSTTDNVEIKTQDANKRVLIQDVPFDEAGATTIPANLGSSVLGAFKKINNNIEITAQNGTNNEINFRYPFYMDSLGRAWPHIANLHPANEFVSGVDFFWANKGALYYPAQYLDRFETGVFYSSGTHNLQISTAASLPLTMQKGSKLYPICFSYNDVAITTTTFMADSQSINIDGDLDIIGRTGTPNPTIGEFKIETTGLPKLRADRTRDNMIATINNQAFHENPANNFTLRAGIWGESSKGYLKVVNAIADGATVVIDGSDVTDEAVSITLTASANPTEFLEFLASTDMTAVADSLAAAINRTTFRTSTSAVGGHKVKAKAVGSTVALEWYKPGQSGDLVIVTGTAVGASNMTLVPFANGTTVLRIYDLDLSVSTTLTTSSTLGGTTISANFFPRENVTDNMIAADVALASSRYSPHYVARELGSVEDKSGNTIAFKIKG